MKECGPEGRSGKELFHQILRLVLICALLFNRTPRNCFAEIRWSPSICGSSLVGGLNGPAATTVEEGEEEEKKKKQKKKKQKKKEKEKIQATTDDESISSFITSRRSSSSAMALGVWSFLFPRSGDSFVGGNKTITNRKAPKSSSPAMTRWGLGSFTKAHDALSGVSRADALLRFFGSTLSGHAQTSTSLLMVALASASSNSSAL